MMDLETPDPSPVDAVPAPADAVPEAVPAAPEPVLADPDEPQSVEVHGGKYVPLDALKAARAESKTYKERAAKADQLEQYVNQVRPYIDVLVANPDLMRPQQPRVEAPAPPEADPDLVELARSLDYYKGDGTPDLDRALRHQAIIERQATKIAQRMVGPVQQNADQQRAAANWQQTVATKLPNGQPIDQTLLANMWRTLPPAYTADPRVAAVVRDLTIAEQMRNSPLPNQPAPPLNAPLHTESMAAAPRASKPLTEIERLVTAARGMDEKTYGTLTKNFVAGRTSSLED